MLQVARRSLVRRLPEPVLDVVVRALHGELRWQRYFTLAVHVRRMLTCTREGYASRLVTVRGVCARIVTEFDAHEMRRENLAAVCDALSAASVPYVLAPRSRQRGHRVAIASEDLGRALVALASVLTGREWAIEGIERDAVPRRPTRRTRRVVNAREGWATSHRGFRVYRWLASPSGQPLAGAELSCDIALWDQVRSRDVERPDGGTFTEGTRLAAFPSQVVVSYLSPQSWQRALGSPDGWPREASLPSMFEVTEPIDLVYTWVDGEDPLWRSRCAEYYGSSVYDELNASAIHNSRYVSRDELRYSLRSVAMYANWVHKIFIVTDQQIPPWLNTEHPKIQIVDHKEIFGEADALPVFNSHAIESQLHHIPELSEHYLYLNDDVFFGRPVRPDLFFHGNGLGKFFLSKATLDMDPPSRQDLPVMSAAKHNRELIERRFGMTVHNKFKHTPHPQLRSVLEAMEDAHPDVFDAVARSRFRHPDDLSITSALYHYYAYGLARAVPGEIRYFYHDIARKDTMRRLENLLRSRNFDVFCLNDHVSDPDRLDEQRTTLAAFFERYFPVPSPFETSRISMPSGQNGALGRSPLLISVNQGPQLL